MLRNYVKFLMFLSSYFPLFGIIIVRNYQHTDLIIVLSTIMVIVTFALVFTFWRIRKVSGTYLKVDKVEDVGKSSVEYFLTYVIPFFTIDFLKLTDLLSFLIVFSVIGVIYIKSDLIHMNPTLNLFGFNIYKIKSDDKDLVVISRKKKNQLFTEEVIPIGDNVLVGRSARNH